MRLLIVRSNGTPIDGSTYNVQETGLARFLASRGIETAVAAVWRGECGDDAFERLDLAVWPGGRAQGIATNLRALRLERFDAIHVTDLHYVVNRQILKHARPRYFVLQQGVHGQEGLVKDAEHRALASLNWRLLRRRPHVLTAKTPAAAAYLERLGAPGAAVVGIGLDDRAFQRPAPLPPDVAAFVARASRLFAYVGILGRRRPLEWALDHARDAALADASFLVVGDGPDAARHRAAYADLVERGRLLFCERLTQAQVSTVYASADALVLPTTLEILGMVAMEALAHGCKVVASDAAGPAYLAAQFPGQLQLVPAGASQAAWRAALVSTTRQGTRPRSFDRTRIAGRVTWEDVGERYLAALAARGVDLPRSAS